ncbi:MAG: cupin domain-containing protein [Planctomycetia bacterium]|nr:cupin domain-containing protein [Planctomycetia bacterium]
MSDIKSPFLLYFKAGLFVVLALCAGTLCVISVSILEKLGFLFLCVWASCRLYYFFFYVLKHHLGGSKNPNIFSSFLKINSAKYSSPPPCTDSVRVQNIFSELPHFLPEETYENIFEDANFRMEKIISTGHVSPPDFWYNQNEHEWVMVLRGHAVLEIQKEKFYEKQNDLSEGHLPKTGCTEQIQMNPGDYIFIPAHQKHRVVHTSTEMATVWLAIFFSPPILSESFPTRQ